MLRVNHIGGQAGRKSMYVYDVLTRMGLTSNLVLCLDAADPRSYDGVSQTWTDRAAGNNFFLGLDATVSATDPTFNGNAGAANANTYFSFDGGDLFKQTAAHTFADNWHKNNGVFTLMAVVDVNNSGATRTIFSTTNATTDGIALQYDSTEVLNFVHSLTNTTAQTVVSTLPISPSGGFHLVGVSFDEADLTGSTCRFYVNNSSEGYLPTGSTATDPTAGYRIGATTDALGSPMASGERIACLVAWNAVVNLTNVRNELVTRFPTI